MHFLEACETIISVHVYSLFTLNFDLQFWIESVKGRPEPPFQGFAKKFSKMIDIWQMSAFLSGSDLGGVPGSTPASGRTQAWAALKFTTFSGLPGTQVDRNSRVRYLRGTKYELNLISNNVIIFLTKCVEVPLLAKEWVRIQTNAKLFAATGKILLIFDPNKIGIFSITEGRNTTGTYFTHKLRIKQYCELMTKIL